MFIDTKKKRIRLSAKEQAALDAAHDHAATNAQIVGGDLQAAFQRVATAIEDLRDELAAAFADKEEVTAPY